MPQPGRRRRRRPAPRSRSDAAGRRRRCSTEATIIRALVANLTDFGDPAILLPVAGCFFAWLLLAGVPRQLALRWLLAVLAFGLLMMASRALFHWYDPLFDDLSLRVPSGHAGATVLVYGAVALVCAAATQGRPRAAIVASGGILIAAIAASRVYLHAHSAIEVVVGLAVGMLSLSWFGAGYLRAGKRSGPAVVGRGAAAAAGFGDWRVLATAVAALAVLIHGNRFSVWPILKAIALYVQNTISTLV